MHTHSLSHTHKQAFSWLKQKLYHSLHHYNICVLLQELQEAQVQLQEVTATCRRAEKQLQTKEQVPLSLLFKEF